MFNVNLLALNHSNSEFTVEKRLFMVLQDKKDLYHLRTQLSLK